MRVLLTVFLFVCASSHADPVQWTLQDTTLDDGSAVSGSFVYDAGLSRIERFSYSEFNVVVSPGSGEAALTFSAAGGTTTVVNALEAGVQDYTGHRMLILIFAEPMTDTGGVIDIRTTSGGAIYSRLQTCANPDCSSSVPFQEENFRIFASGQITTPVRLTEEQLHEQLAEALFVESEPPYPAPFLAVSEGYGLVIEEMQRRGYYILIRWIPQWGGRCVSFWPSGFYECRESKLPMSVGNAALAALD